MRAQCIICQELFENEDEVISAISCGHTFHNHCLNQWLENSRTCPSCRVNVDRRKIIQRLYFDCPEDNDEVIDDCKLRNEIDQLKLEVRKREKEKHDAIKDKEVKANKIEALQKSNDKLSKLVKEEQTKNSSHIKTLKYYQSQQKSIEIEREEYKKTKQKLVTLQSLQVLLEGSESEAADLIATVGEGSTSAVQSLSRQIAFLKREFEKLKFEKRQLKDQYDKIQLHDMSKNKKISDLTKDNGKLKDQLERSEGDLKIAEKEIEFIRKTNIKLKEKFKKSLSPGCSHCRSKSFTEIMNESTKMEVFAASTPKLGVQSREPDIDLDITPDLFLSPEQCREPSSQNFNSQSSSRIVNTQIASGKLNTQTSSGTVSTNTNNKKRLLDSGDVENQVPTKFLKITSAAEKKAQKLKSDSTINDVNSVTALASMNIFRKKDFGERNSKMSIVKKGFDGLGGHTTHVQPRGNPFKKPIKLKKSSAKSTSVPSLSKMDNFVILD
ncbi:hypothetical protein ACF0H5_014751 [Mactra antiquata]